MSQLKTQRNDQSVEAYLEAVSDEKKKAFCRKLLPIMEKITGEKPLMWGNSIVGFGSYHYRYASGREGDWFLTGFSPRKQSLTIYIMPGFSRFDELMAKLV